MNVRSLIEGAVTATVGVMAVVVIWSHLGASSEGERTDNGSAYLPKSPIRTGDSLKGNPQAPVAMIIFSDFECNYCRRFATEVQPVLEKKYVRPGSLLIAFRHLPNDNIHPRARQAASAAACAGQQGQFWEMHDLLFGMEPPISRSRIMAAARGRPLNVTVLEECVADEAGGVVDRDLNEGAALRLSGTPTFFIGLRNDDGTVTAVSRIAGLRPVPAFTASIDAALSR